ncbi:Methyltransferase type 11 [Beutenbergia cavernae DSM 12333]|uniref:Methyltransferase type 11 n=1 Tax=Beutenbergia cavernae (strain ATCC BAA-8 / DSM 12333 / CCUG 43141 / JCM 11478 / NBRC 16432 / NCIMB 13614 / HKI 0122) TaxID=471853 RepID=C5C6D4_BEUC1|nr:methyltransferase domain-containing protein [Beutenbergia cavernae]ACQ80340.1 Methyltransferase type 11 [Beutenbergia cavernae DSM 12333]
MAEPRTWQSETARLGNADPSDPTGWFEELWSSATAGDVTMPWDRGDPHPALASWTNDRDPGTASGTAVVVGCGLGADAEYLARLGYETTAFDISPTAVAAARERHPGSPVTYAVGDLLELPRAWLHAFDLVVEIYTVQAVNRSVRSELTAGVRSLVASSGTLLAIQAIAVEGDDDGPPWPLTRAEIEAFGQDGLTPVSTEELAVPDSPHNPGIWRAEFRQA